MFGKYSRNCASIAKAKKKTFALTTLITFSFIILWAPYYGMGIYSWFNADKAKLIPKNVRRSFCSFLHELTVVLLLLNEINSKL